jgi:hypothetical protein
MSTEQQSDEDYSYRDGETHEEWRRRVNGPRIRASRQRQREVVATGTWQPVFSSWRHGGWYVDNLAYPSGAVGCVSRNFTDKKWRIIDHGTGPAVKDDITYATRNEAAYAELAQVLAMPEEY